MTFDIRKYITENNDALNEFSDRDMGQLENASEKLRRGAAQSLSALSYLTKQGRPLKNKQFDSLAHTLINFAVNLRHGAERLETMVNHEHDQRTRN